MPRSGSPSWGATRNVDGVDRVAAVLVDRLQSEVPGYIIEVRSPEWVRPRAWPISWIAVLLMDRSVKLRVVVNRIRPLGGNEALPRTEVSAKSGSTSVPTKRA